MTARHAGVNVPLFSAAIDARAGASARLPDLVPLSPWLARAGVRPAACCCRSARCRTGETSPYSADVHAGDRSDLHRARRACRTSSAPAASPRCRRRRATALDAARAVAGRRATTRCGARSTRRSVSRSTSFLPEEWEQLHAARGGARRVHRARALVARRLRALSGARRSRCRARRWREWPAPLRDRDPRALDDARRQLGARGAAAPVPGSGSPNGSGRRARARPRAHGVSHRRRPAVRRRTSRARRSGRGPTSSCSTCRSACRRMPSARPARTGDCRPIAGTRSRATGYAWMRQRAPAHGGALRRPARRSRHRSLPHVRPAAATGEPFFTPADEADADRAGRGRPDDPAGERSRADRRGSGRRAGFRARVARAARHSRLQGPALGARLARAGRAVRRSGSAIRRCRRR